MMRYVLPVLLFTILAGSCKLMKKEHHKEAGNKTNDKMNQFNVPDWLHTTNIYEVNVRQYTEEGTFNAFSTQLDRLVLMGVKTLWFMPITPIAVKNRKGSMGSYYACSDYTSINPEFGTLEDFKNLVKKAHGLGLKVIIDWVANHTGWDHTWTQSHPAYYKIDSVTNDFKIASGMDDIIELDFNNPALRKAMIEAMQFWVKTCDIDGFRCDLASWVTLDFWREARTEIDALKPLCWLGEFDELENPDYGKLFDASYSWEWMHRTEDFYKQNLPLDTLRSLLNRYDQLGDRSMRAWFTSNHDENSWNGSEYEKYGDMAKALAVFSATWNGIPLIYSGQEQPNRQRLAFFERDPIRWNKKQELQDFYQILLALHSNNPALRGGDSSVATFQVITNHPSHVLAYRRKKGMNEVLVLLNFSANHLFDLQVTDENLTGKFRNVFSGEETDFNSTKTIELNSWGYLVFEK